MVGTIIAVIIALLVGMIFGGAMASNGGTYKDEYIAIVIENKGLKKENQLFREDVAKITEYMSAKVNKTEFVGKVSVDTAIEHIEAQRQEILGLEKKLKMATEYIEQYSINARRSGDDSPKSQILIDLKAGAD